MDLNYDVLQKEMSELFRLISEEQEILKKSNAFIFEDSIEKLKAFANKYESDINKIAIKTSKIDARQMEAIMAVLGITSLKVPNIPLFILKHWKFFLFSATVGLGGVSIGAYNRNMAEKRARQVLDKAFKSLVVNLQQLDELLNQKIAELDSILLSNVEHRKELETEIDALTGKISEIRCFIVRTTI